MLLLCYRLFYNLQDYPKECDLRNDFTNFLQTFNEMHKSLWLNTLIREKFYLRILIFKVVDIKVSMFMDIPVCNMHTVYTRVHADGSLLPGMQMGKGGGTDMRG